MKTVLTYVLATKAIAQVLSTKSGWTTIRNADGTEAKVRNSGLREPTQHELDAYHARHAAKAPGDEDEDEADARLVKANLGKYVTHEAHTASGRKAFDINDEAAEILRGQTLEDCYFVVAKHLAKADGGKATDIEAELLAKYKHLNPGMQRMNLGNRLRKAMGTYGHLNARKTPAAPKAPKVKAVKAVKVKAVKPARATKGTVHHAAH